ncbi:EAL domain-containing protein [Roseomonas terrae]|uniref:EAL domain-containing protein n=1 Tax=Neoroseomonas terrae TaxID=424799 RepID=A0ABS5EHU5_9PROT|nr:EAL domain-containing protein [Neoroseomonas terrae]MBR0650602.1 EAL domain-containing protein [Neoroseomonas terrae]
MDGMAAQEAGGASSLLLGEELAETLARGGAGLRLDLQPICAASNLLIVGYEALLRWDHPERGPIGAAEVLAAAAAAGREVALEAWVLVSAFRLRAGWRPGAPYLAVNVSAPGILAGHAAPMIRAALETTGIDPRALSIELPEVALIQDIGAARDLAAALRGCGIAVALDDFGGALGPARVLRDIPFSTVKLDRQLTGAVDPPGPGTDRARAAVGAVVEMVHALGATAVAEAVETAEQLRILRESGCDALQGWLLGRPGQGPM